MRVARLAVIVLILTGMLSIGIARAENTAHEDFTDHFFKACVPFVLSGRSPDGYIRNAVSNVTAIPRNPDMSVNTTGRSTPVRKLLPADPNQASDFLHGQSGRVFIQIDQYTPMTLTLFDNGVCVVGARDMPDMNDLLASTEKRLKTLSPPFKDNGDSNVQDGDGHVVSGHRYVAEVDGHKFQAIFSTSAAPGLDQVGGVVAMIARLADN